MAYPTVYGITNIVALGHVSAYVNDNRVWFLTSDGLYHIDSTTRSPNCGLL